MQYRASMRFPKPRLRRNALLVLALAIALGAAAWAAWRWQPGPWARTQLAQAQALADADRLDEARAALRRVLVRLPREREARWRLIQLELRQRRLEPAYLELKTYTELFPDDAGGWMQIAGLLAGGGLVDEAETALDYAVAAAGDATAPRAMRARVRARRGRLFGAAVDARAVLAQNPDDAALREFVRQLEAAPAPSPPPPGRIRRGGGRERGALAESHAMVWPGNLAVLRRDADQRIQQKDWDGARAVAQRAEQGYPGSVLAPWILGVVELARGEPAAAERHLQDSLARAPRSALVTKGLAQAWTQQPGGAQAAGEKLETLAAADPGFAFARRHAATSYLNARRPDLAEAALRAGTRAASDAGPWRDLAGFYLEVDRAAEALKACAEGLARFAGDAELRALQARIHAAAGNDEAAMALLRPLVAAAPDRAHDAALLARLLARHGETARAAELLAQLERDAPAELAVVADLGWAWQLAGKPRRAVPWLEAAARAAPERPELRYRLAAAYAKSGRHREARAELEAALDSGTPFAEQPEAQKLLRSL
jgi:predicted Zn-dependent protease